MRANNILAIFTATLALAACDSDAAKELLNPVEPDVGPVMVEFEAEPETLIKDLDDSGRDALCDAWYRAVEAQIPARTQCVIPGLASTGVDTEQSAAEAEAQCGDNVDICTRLVLIGESSLPAIPNGPCFLAAPTGDCTSTVANVEPCMNGMADVAVSQFRNLVTCDLARLDSVPDLELTAPSSNEVMACGQITLDCPGIFGAEAEPED